MNKWINELIALGTVEPIIKKKKKKKKIRQNITKPCVTELRLQSVQVDHAFLVHAVC